VATRPLVLDPKAGERYPFLPKEKRASAEIMEMVDHRHDLIIESHVKR
jgi:hypothetical protein